MEERLQKLLAAAGVASRRQCEDIILSGRVKVNDVTVTALGTKADLGKDKIEVDGEIIGKKERKIYVLLNKPEGYLCTVSDTHERKTVLDLLPEWNVRMYPVGRLDMDTEGLIILTNDGKFTNEVIHPSHQVDKVYNAVVKGSPSKEQLSLLRKGIIVDDEQFSPAKIRFLGKSGKDTRWEIIIHEGKKRQVKRMFKAIGHDVLKLKRTAIGFLTISGIKEGEWRFLKKDEIRRLVMEQKPKTRNKPTVVVDTKDKFRGGYYGKTESRKRNH